MFLQGTSTSKTTTKKTMVKPKMKVVSSKPMVTRSGKSLAARKVVRKAKKVAMMKKVKVTIRREPMKTRSCSKLF